jgi:site-specific DNA-methyltransferase (adenine-specific)
MSNAVAVQKAERPRLRKSLRALVSSARQDWCTPEQELALVRALAPIGLDPCSNPRSIVFATTAWTEADDGLSRSWNGHGLVYVNPPYGRRTLPVWAQKCAAEGESSEVVVLVPARTDTVWFQQNFAPPAATGVCFRRGRIRFLGARAGATFPSAYVYFGKRPRAFAHVFGRVGRLWMTDPDALRAHAWPSIELPAGRRPTEAP